MEVIVFSLTAIATLFLAIVIAKYIWIAFAAFLRLVWSVSVIAGLVLLFVIITDSANVYSAVKHVYRVCPACVEATASMWNMSSAHADYVQNSEANSGI